MGSSNSFQFRLLCSSTAAAPFQQQGLHLYSTSGAAQVQGFENRANVVIAIKSEKYGEEHGGGVVFFSTFFCYLLTGHAAMAAGCPGTTDLLNQIHS